MSQSSPPKESFDLLDKGMIVLTITALVALLLNEPSIDSAKPVFITGIILFTTSVIVRYVRRQQKNKHQMKPSQGEGASEPSSLEHQNDRYMTQKDVMTILEKNAVIDHDELIGMEELLERLRDYLIDPKSGWIISLFGEGG